MYKGDTHTLSPPQGPDYSWVGSGLSGLSSPAPLSPEDCPLLSQANLLPQELLFQRWWIPGGEFAQASREALGSPLPL